MEKRHRIFIAINLPDEVKKVLVRHQEKLMPQFGEMAKWTSRDNLHITLEFLGYVTDEEISDVCHILKEVSKRHEVFSVNLSQIIYGPKGKMPPKMIWATGEKSEELSLLREDLENALLEKVRFTPEGRMFSPHITLARFNSFSFQQMETEEIPEVNEFLELIFTVESLEVMESELTKKGPRYTILESCTLGE